VTAPQPVLERVQALLLARRPEQALTELGTLPAAEVTGPVAMLLRCVALSQLGRWSEVGEAARAGLSAAGPDPGLLLWLARAERESGRDQAAERVLLDGLALDPHDVDLLCEYAELCADNGQADKAGKLVGLAAAQDPHAPLVYGTRVRVALARGDDREAERISREFVAAYPESPTAHALLGGASAARGRIDAAYDGFRRAAAAMPAEPAFAAAALELKVARHPLMAPLRPVARIGALKVWLAAVAVMTVLRMLHLGPLAVAAAVIWVTFCVYSWVVPPLVRRWVRRGWR